MYSSLSEVCIVTVSNNNSDIYDIKTSSFNSGANISTSVILLWISS